MKTFWRNTSRSGCKPAGSGDDSAQPVRFWLVGSVSLVLVACVGAVLLFIGGSPPKPPATAPLESGRTGVEPALPAPKATASGARLDLERGRHEPALLATDASLEDGSTPLQVPVEATEVEDDQPVEFEAAALSDPATLRVYLSGGDPALVEAALQAASRRDKELASQTLLDLVNDTSEPRRSEILQRLCASPYVDEATVTAALSTALHDADYALVTQAVRALSDRSDAAALGLLSEALDTGERSTKLFILETIVNNHSAEPLVKRGLNDPDEAVRSAAQAVLALRTKSARPGRGEESM